VSKYSGLTELLQRIAGPLAAFGSDDLAAAVPRGLPASAYRYNAWWSNDASGSHMHTNAWLVAGWRVDQLHLLGRSATFRRATL
jgi:hypothetical protein